ncbi:MAG: glycosyltransferase family 2 protein [Rhodovarius sp.]|nr:glycosyltransferase family 2 protein [Rhodovarius sp.]
MAAVRNAAEGAAGFGGGTARAAAERIRSAGGAAGRPRQILIVSPSLPGLHQTDAPGHLAWYLAQRLAAEGAAPRLLIPRQGEAGESATRWWAACREAGIPADILPEPDGAEGLLGWRTLEWLRRRPLPDLLIALDARGIAATLLLARSMGLALVGLPILVAVSGWLGWADPPDTPRGPRDLQRAHLERQAMAGADALLFAHSRLREAWAATGAALPPHLVLPPLGAAELDPALPPAWLAAEAPPHAQAARRLAAFARSLAPDGPPLVLPLPRGAGDGKSPDPLLAFLEELAGERPPLRLAAGRPPPELRPPRLPAKAQVLLSDPADLAAPLAQDAAAAGLPVLLLDHSGRAAPVVFAEDVPLLPFLARIPAPPPPPPPPDPPPLVSVCISHFDRPQLLAQTLDSLRAQTWPRLEVVLVDDASPSAATREFLAAQEADFAARGWQILRNETEAWQSVSRNRAVAAARGELILIMDDDNLARPEEVEVMVRALYASGADAVGALQDLFEGEGNPLAQGTPRLPRVGFFPHGGPADLGVVWNVFGDVNVLFRREAFEEVGGYTPEIGLGCEDYELGAALAARGRRLLVIPQPLYLYRYSAVNMAKGMSNERLYWSHRRPLRPALAGLSPAAQRLLLFVHGVEHAQQQGQGWSYWAGRPFSAPLPELHLPDPDAPGQSFALAAAALALRAGNPGPLRRMLPRLLGHPGTPALLEEAVLADPADPTLRTALLAADAAAGTARARRVLLRLVEAGRDAEARLLAEALAQAEAGA